MLARKGTVKKRSRYFLMTAVVLLAGCVLLLAHDLYSYNAAMGAAAIRPEPGRKFDIPKPVPTSPPSFTPTITGTRPTDTPTSTPITPTSTPLGTPVICPPEFQ